MGVYIIGKEPDRCGVCPCFHAENPMYCQAVKAAVQKPRIVRPYANGRPDWCPLVSIPEPHGRLIDADELYAFVGTVVADKTDRDVALDCKVKAASILREFIRRAPTIIPAEEDE